ncbi:tetratricopeptide repeat protein [Sessilibacter sp. MAH4]
MAFSDLMEQIKTHPTIVAISLFGCLIVGALGSTFYLKVTEERSSLVNERIERLEYDSKSQKKVNKIVLNQIAALRTGYEKLPISLGRIKDELSWFSEIDSLDSVRKKKFLNLVKVLDNDMKAVNIALEKSEAILSTFDEFLQASLAESQQNYSQAYRLYLSAANTGNTEAAYRLATLYARGAGVDKDYVSAEHWYQRAALEGSTEARSELAQLWVSGEGITREPEKALALYYLIQQDAPISFQFNSENLEKTMTKEQLLKSLKYLQEFDVELEELPDLKFKAQQK